MNVPERVTTRHLLREALGFGQLLRLAWKAPGLLGRSKGVGAPVLLVPGFGAGDGSTAMLRGYLRLLGYRVEGWGLGRNRGNVRQLIPRLLERTLEVRQVTGCRVGLIGWSLGGYLAREVAREAPAAVAHVVTLGTPVVGGPKYTAVAGIYRRRGYDLDAIESQVAARDRVPLRVPTTAIYSRRDGIVSWHACIDRKNDCVEHVEVATTHLGLGFCPEVYRIIADRLSAAAGSV